MAESTLRPRATRPAIPRGRLTSSERARASSVQEGTAAPGAGFILHLQRSAGNASVAALLEGRPSPVHEVLTSGRGRRLDDSVRPFMEARFGHDFGDVRVHSDEIATQAARSVNAHAFTVGDDVVFRSDKYKPLSEAGRRMLAHELAHVVQQRAGPVAGSPAPGGVNISDPSDPFEKQAEMDADQAMNSPKESSATSE